MNTQIKKLSEQLINQIAAGEVVERPASVVKELIENSIDAEATHITIELAEGGKTLVKIIDNGNGLTFDQFDLVFERHATSKINSLQDLEQNQFLGFRGEALATIASVSRIEFASNGYFINNNEESGPKAMSAGTQVTVKDLFFNTPARQKFLKTDQTEYNQCLQIVEQYALAHPEKSFTLIHNGRQIFNLPVCDSKTRIAQVLGDNISQKLLPVFFKGTDMQIEGYIGKPELAKDKMSHQYVFVSGRPLHAQFVAHAVRAAFGSTIFPSEKPLFVLYISVQPQDVDMNVHPRKTEARFHFQAILYSNIMRAVKKAIESNVLTPSITLQPQKLDSYIPNPTSFTFNTQERRPPVPGYSSHREAYQISVENEPKLKPIYQVANSYIVCESETGLTIIDQHAAHERVMYERFKDIASSKTPNSQKLLLPLTLEISESEHQTILLAKEVLAQIGFEIEDFGSKTIIVHAIPSKFNKNDITEVLKGIIEDLKSETDLNSLQNLQDIVLHYAACRGAIKFGQPLSQYEQVALIKEMEAIAGREYSCPHGRPTMIELTFDDLEKQFKRK